MGFIKYFTIIFLNTALISCGSGTGSKKNDFGIKTNAEKGDIAVNKTLLLSVESKKNKIADSATFTLNGLPIEASSPLKNLKLGKHNIEATIFFNGEKQTASTTITVLNDQAPKIFTYNIVNQYPHDIMSYTQGLEFHDGILYESTGQYGESKLRKTNYKTGEVIKNIDLPKEYFAEGLTIFNQNIYQLTWREGVGFVYNADTFEKTNSFKYGKSKEGWGLCHDGATIYKSDGTETVWLLNPETLAEENHIQIYTNKGKIIGINEMEWVNGSIYANRYQKDGVAIINPKNGAVIGVIDFTPLKKLVTQHEGLDVLNGIAYNPETKTLFVTGKRWDKLFEVEIVEP
ncbi:MAG: glutaminyl-peptide cyclotransferase [Flavobacteriaceae bacterium]